MVLPKKFQCLLSGYQLPANARAPRSARKRRLFKKTDEDNRMWAFDLLATLAGSFLKGEPSPTSGSALNLGDKCALVQNTVKKECPREDELVKVETIDREKSDSGFLEPKNVRQAHQERSFKHDTYSVYTSGNTISECPGRLDPQKSVNGDVKNEMSGFGGKAVGHQRLSNARDFRKPDEIGKLNTNIKPNASSDNGTEVPVCGNSIPVGSFPVCQPYVNLVSKDDDENSSGCTHPCTPKRLFRPAPRIGDRRIRKILASRYCNAARKSKKAVRSYADRKPAYYKRNSSYTRLRCEKNYPIKKRKYLKSALISNSDGGISSEDAAELPSKIIDKSGSISKPKMNSGNRVASLRTGQRASFVSRESHVKLRIKSFRVPELFIEIPETATIGSLKRTVVEAVTAILGGGLRVGVLYRGRKVRDDRKTLLQTGISQHNQSDAVGFCLEPNLNGRPSALCLEESDSQLPCNMTQPIISYPPSPEIFKRNSSQDAGAVVESDHDSAPSPPDMSDDKNPQDSRALVPVPEMKVEALNLGSSNRKLKGPEAGQRRIRRPFSVAEVEALVQAVEILGTGRWRDVKLRAFDNAKHRTYVDLKDKWKTLVHTARISPHQRRGEPVPQELLDRVLRAHAFWSQAQHQAKQLQTKPPLGTPGGEAC